MDRRIGDSMDKKQDYPTQTVTIPAASPECIVALPPKVYASLKSLVERAEGRGLSTRFAYWLEKTIEVGVKSTQRPWDDRDLLTAVKEQLKAKQAESVQIQ